MADQEKLEKVDAAAGEPVPTHSKASLPKVKVPKVMHSTQGFVDFIRTQGVVGLAVGIVLGVQIKSVVDSFVAGFANPILGLLLPGNANLALKATKVTIGDRTAIFAWGAFLVQIITFLIVAVVVYLFVHTLKLDQLDKTDKPKGARLPPAGKAASPHGK